MRISVSRAKKIMNCKECGKIVDLKPGDDIPGVGYIAHDYVDIDICKACLSGGWMMDPEEVAEAMRKDPNLKLVEGQPSSALWFL